MVDTLARVSVTVTGQIVVEEVTELVVSVVYTEEIVLSEPDPEPGLLGVTVYTVVPATRVSVVAEVVFSRAGQLVTVAGHS